MTLYSSIALSAIKNLLTHPISRLILGRTALSFYVHFTGILTVAIQSVFKSVNPFLLRAHFTNVDQISVQLNQVQR